MESRRVFLRSRSRSSDKDLEERHTDFRILAGISDQKDIVYLMINNDSVNNIGLLLLLEFLVPRSS